MHYQILYRLAHPGGKSHTSLEQIEAGSKRQIEETIARIRQKWELRGYSIEILSVNKGAFSRLRGKEKPD